MQHSSFAGSWGWSVTEPGRVDDERRMAAEVEAAGAREAVTDVHAGFVGVLLTLFQPATQSFLDG